jgi:hypothetical protein
MANMNKALGTDLASIAQLLRSKGRGKDSVLAHITPKEAALLKRRGGRGSVNPDTGLPEFDDEEGGYVSAPVEQAPAPEEQAVAPVTDYSQAYTPEVPVEQAPANISDYSQPAPQYAFTPAEMQAGSQRDMSTPFQNVSAADTAAARTTLGMDTAGGTTGTTKLDTGDTGTGPGKPSTMSDLLKGLGISGSTAARLGLGAGLGAYGASQARKTADQIAAAQAQQQALATPYQSQGQQLVAQAQQGQLTPGSQQAYAAAKAQLAQSQANRGGVGAQQASNQLAQIYQNLLNNQYNYGLKVMNIGDNIAMGAIKTGLQLDAQLNTATTNFYSQLANYVSGGNMAQQAPIQAQVGV